MARRVDTSAYKNFDQITDRLDAIIGLVRDKDTSLEKSLDLFDEAIALGSKAVDMVDTTNFTPQEEAKLREGAAAKEEEAEQGEGTTSEESQEAEAASESEDAQDGEAKAEDAQSKDA